MTALFPKYCSVKTWFQQAVLCPASCLSDIHKPNNIRVIVGEYDWAIPEASQKELSVLGIVKHENYTFFSNAYDIAIIQLGEKIDLDSQ